MADKRKGLLGVAGFPVGDTGAEARQGVRRRFPPGDRLAGAAERHGDAGGVVAYPLGRALQLIEAGIHFDRDGCALQERGDGQSGLGFAAEKQAIDGLPEGLAGELFGLKAADVAELPAGGVNVGNLPREGMGNEIERSLPAGRVHRQLRAICIGPLALVQWRSSRLTARRSEAGARRSR